MIFPSSNKSNKYVMYIRVSTKKQGASGLGLDAQRDICKAYIESMSGELIEEFQDIESGTHRDRPGLWKAIECCKKNNYTLVIAKLDRLARDVEFIFKVVNSNIRIHFCDMPVVNTMILGVFASVAQYERELISQRTKAALAQKKKQGVKIGRPKGTSLENAQQASSIARRERALNSPFNKTIWEVCEQCRESGKNKPTPCKEEFERALQTLVNIGTKTPTGLDLNLTRLIVAYNNIRRMKGLTKYK